MGYFKSEQCYWKIKSIELYLKLATIWKCLPRGCQLNNVITHTKKPFHLSSPHGFLLKGKWFQPPKLPKQGSCNAILIRPRAITTIDKPTQKLHHQIHTIIIENSSSNILSKEICKLAYVPQRLVMAFEIANAVETPFPQPDISSPSSNFANLSFIISTSVMPITNNQTHYPKKLIIESKEKRRKENTRKC